MKLELSDVQYDVYIRAFDKQARIDPDVRKCWRAGMQAVLASVAAAQAAPVVPAVAPHGEHVLDFVPHPPAAPVREHSPEPGFTEVHEAGESYPGCDPERMRFLSFT